MASIPQDVNSLCWVSQGERARMLTCKSRRQTGSLPGTFLQPCLPSSTRFKYVLSALIFYASLEVGALFTET